MSRRKSNPHTLVKGAWRREHTRNHIHTASGLGRTYFAIPPEGGWRGGLPEHNGWRPGAGKR